MFKPAKRIAAAALILLLALCGCTAQGELAPIPEYEVRFELNGGTLVSGELLQVVRQNQSAVPPAVEREGYAFDGWTASVDQVQGDMVTAAKWIRQYTIRFDPGIGAVTAGETTQQLKQGELPQAPEVSLENGEFLGWEPEIAAVTGNATYTAKWKLPEKPKALSPEELYEAISPAVVEITVYDRNGDAFALGSGFFIDDQGLLVTNYHVMEGAYYADAALSDGSVVEIETLADYNADLDLAIVRAEITGNACLPLAEEGVHTGESVYALGSSLGLTGTFSGGIVSRANRTVEGIRCIQITTPISHGNSGGPLVNVYGQVVGVNAMGIEEGQNLNFAIDIRELKALGREGNIRLWDFGAETDQGTTISGPSGGGFYDDLEAAEEEYNDSWRLADPLLEEWTAGELPDYYDTDWFRFELTEPAEVTLEAAPYLRDEGSLYWAVLCTLEEEELVLLETMTEVDNGSYIALVAARALEPGEYFLGITAANEVEVPDDSYPLYYAVRVTVD